MTDRKENTKPRKIYTIATETLERIMLMRREKATHNKTDEDNSNNKQRRTKNQKPLHVSEEGGMLTDRAKQITLCSENAETRHDTAHKRSSTYRM